MTDPHPDLRHDFISGMSYAACTVNVVTTDGPAGRVGVTVSAMSSVSADSNRPTLLVCVHELSPAAQAIIANGVFCVNVLRDTQSFISDVFAGRVKTPGGDKFECATWAPCGTGAPRVADALVAFDCRLVSAQQVGTHHVFIGSVEHVFITGSGSPLIYAHRAYGTRTRLNTHCLSRSSPLEVLRVGSFHTFGPYVVPEVLERLVRAGRTVDARLVEGDQVRVIDALRSGEIEIALLFDFDLDSNFRVERLASMKPYVLLPDGHRLAERDALSLAQLADEPLVLLEAPPGDRYFLSLFGDNGLKANVNFRTRSFEMVRGLVGHGLGYSILATKPASNITYDGRALVTRPLDREVAVSHVALASRHDQTLSDIAQAFASECRDVFASGSNA